MAWLLILAGLMLLLLVAILTHALRSKGNPAGRCAALPFPRGALRKLRKLAALDDPGADVSALRADALSLLMHLRRLQSQVRGVSLPAGEENEPRLMEPARETADSDDFSEPALHSALKSRPDALTSQECAAFPLAVGCAEAQRLNRILRALQQDAADRRDGCRFARRLQQVRNPQNLLARCALNTMGLSALIGELRSREQHQLLALTEAWLGEHHLASADVTAAGLSRQLQLAEEIRRARACFEALGRLSWRCECADHMHALMLQEPSGVYGKMTRESQLDLRLRLERISRIFRSGPEQVLRQAFILCSEAEKGAPEGMLSYYLLDPHGLTELRKSVSPRGGRLYALVSLRQEPLRYGALLIFSIAAGFLFLQLGQPVLMLPFFLLTIGCLPRACRFPAASLPAMDASADDPDLSALIIIHAEMADPHAAIQAVRRLKTIRHTLGTSRDYLLLGDFGPAITAISSSDGPVIQAASAALAALEAPNVFYLQRGRSWDSASHCYRARADMRGAADEICRLIAQGECADTIAFSTLDPASLERRYAYVLTLPAQCTPDPDLLTRLLQAMAHPLNRRDASGNRGHAMLLPEETREFIGPALIRPDDYLEATDGLTPLFSPDFTLCGELAGAVCVKGAHVQLPAQSMNLQTRYGNARRAWKLARWQLPWVQTPSGMISRPLKFLPRFRLREQLRRALVPVGRLVLLLWSVLTGSWPLLLITLLAPEAGNSFRRLEDFLHMICRWSLLPARALAEAAALLQALWYKPFKLPEWSVLELWAQGLSAALMAALAFVIPGYFLPCAALAAVFGGFPLAHRFVDTPVLPGDPLTGEDHALLEETAEASWHFFAVHVNAASRRLPPCALQPEPETGAELFTSPRAIGAYLLACLCAKDTGMISADAAAQRILQTVRSTAELPMPNGLPCRRYSLPALAVADGRTDAAETGFLLASLMTAAQALRTWLPELSPEYASASAEVGALAASFDLSALYDEASGLFHSSLDADGQGQGHAALFADETLLLCAAACARGDAPPELLRRLQRTQITLHGVNLPLSRHGSASEYLLPGLFLPLPAEPAEHFIQIMEKRGRDGLWGQDESRYFAFDAALRHRSERFGIPEVALDRPSDAPVYAPHAAALALFFAPATAIKALRRFQEHGSLSPEGFCDAIDLTQGAVCVRTLDAFHQGLTLAAASHLLADEPIRRYFCAIPEVEGLLPLLSTEKQPLTLPALFIPPKKAAEESAAPRTPRRMTLPADAHLLGTPDFHLVCDANGCSSLYARDISLTGGFGGLDGPQFYLADEGDIYRLGSALLPGDAAFAPGEIRCEQVCGSLRAEIVTTVDVPHRQALHIITLTNLAARDRLVDLASLVLPAQGNAAVRREGKAHLSLQGMAQPLHHAMNTSLPPLAESFCTDFDAFLGRNGTLHAPASLLNPPADFAAPSLSPCMSLRARFALGGRGQLCAWFTTGISPANPPALHDLSGVRKLAGLQHQAVRESAGFPSDPHGLEGLLSPLRNASWRLALRLESAAGLLTGILPFVNACALHGMPLRLCIVRPEALAGEVNELLTGYAASEPELLSPEDFTPARWPLVLTDALPPDAQIRALYRPLQLPAAPKLPIPALLPEIPLRFDHPLCGFDPETGDLVIHLAPDDALPARWENQHITRRRRETVTDSGLAPELQEQVYLETADGTLLSPWSAGLPRMVRFKPGETVWETWTDRIDVKLTACALPGHPCGMRTLRVRNAADKPLLLTVSVLARLGNDISAGQGVLCAENAFLAADGWNARRTDDLSAFTEIPVLHAPDSPDGALALLQTEITLAPNASGTVTWLCGTARHSEDIARALKVPAAQGTSSILRAVRESWARRLSIFTFTTPEDTLTLLLNRILPVQAWHSSGLSGAAALTHLAPREARRRLLRAAKDAHSPRDWAYAALALADYTRITRDDSLLEIRLSNRDAPLYACCRDALLSVPLDRRSLPISEAPAADCFLFAAAAHALTALRPDAALSELQQSLLTAADLHLWQDGFYGKFLRLDVQHLAALALGNTPRVRQALSACWETLYDQPRGLFRLQLPDDAQPLPGTPRNGGMVMPDAVAALRALLQTHLDDAAFELLSALNPLHHTDTPERQEIFRLAPNRLPGGMLGAPLSAGQAIPDGGDSAAALLYAVILEDVLGFRREGNAIRIVPHVPPDWEGYTITLREGSSTWRISVERRLDSLTIDGEEKPGDAFIIHDDGKIHRVRVPLK